MHMHDRIMFLQYNEQKRIVIQYNIPTLTRLWSCKIYTCHSANTSTVHSSDINVVTSGTLQSRDNNSVISYIKLRGES